jgi:hypothetical protein
MTTTPNGAGQKSRSGEKDSPSGWRWLKRPAVWVGTLITAVITGVLINLATGAASHVSAQGGTNSSDTSSNAPSSSDTSSSDTSSSAYYTVYGQIVHRDTGRPYPNSYVRFGWLENANYEKESHTVTDGSGRYSIQLPAGQYQVTAGDSCDLNAGFAIVGRARDDIMITVPGTSVVDFVEYPITPGADLPGAC